MVNKCIITYLITDEERGEIFRLLEEIQKPEIHVEFDGENLENYCNILKNTQLQNAKKSEIIVEMLDFINNKFSERRKILDGTYFEVEK